MGKECVLKNQDLIKFGFKLNKYFHPLEVVGRDSETQLQVGDNLNYLIKKLQQHTSQHCKCWTNLTATFQEQDILSQHNAGLTLGQCHRRWSNITASLVEYHNSHAKDCLSERGFSQ